MNSSTNQALQLISAGAAMGLCQHIWGAQVQGRFGAVGAMYDLYLSEQAQGISCDLLILARAQLDRLNAAGELLPGSLQDIGRVSTGLAVRADAPNPPKVSDAESLKALLLSASQFFTPDMKQSTAGQHVARVLQGLGIFEALQSKISEHPNGATAMRLMGQAPNQNPALTNAYVGCTQATEILYTPGVRLVGLLPAPYELATLYSIAIPKTCKNPQAAQGLMARLLGAEFAATRLASGFDAD